MMRIITGLLLTFLAVALFSCKEDDLEKQREDELRELNEYIQNNYPDLDPTASGLYYIPMEEGSGDSIQIGDRVQFFYDLLRLDSTYVQGSGRYEPVEVVVLPPTQLSSSAQNVRTMLGLHEALTYMKPGGKASLILPSQLAFGQYGSYAVSGFTSLIMEVEIYKVYPAESPEEQE